MNSFSFKVNCRLSTRTVCADRRSSARLVIFDSSQRFENVILFFSVNSSGHFQGYARMLSPVDPLNERVAWHSAQAKQQKRSGRAASAAEDLWGSTFMCKWECVRALPFRAVEHLTNPWNCDESGAPLPVKICRDGTGAHIANSVSTYVCLSCNSSCCLPRLRSRASRRAEHWRAIACRIWHQRTASSRTACAITCVDFSLHYLYQSRIGGCDGRGIGAAGAR